MSEGGQNRRTFPRLKLKLPVEITTESSDAPIRGATSDLSVNGCYIESMFPLPVGSLLDLKLQAENTLLIEARVVTSDPQVGNGIVFEKMLEEDREELEKFLEAAAKEAESS